MRYDFIIIGGGLVGLSLAVALRGTNYTIALVDQTVLAANDPRRFALNAVSCQFLNKIKVWDKLTPHAAAIHAVHVSHQGHFGALTLHREDVSLQTLGAVVQAGVIESTLNQCVASMPNVTVFRPARVTTLTPQSDHINIAIDTGTDLHTLQARFLFGADGSDSTVRKLLKVPTHVLDYRQNAIVTHTILNRPHQQIAYERFTEQGAIAMLPLPDEGGQPIAATIWTTETHQATRLLALSDQAFVAALQQAFGYRLGRLQQIGKRYTFPLRYIQAEPLIAPNIMLLGNAAHTVHPISAQGFNLALYETAYLAETLSANEVALTPAVLERIVNHLKTHQAASLHLARKLPHFLGMHHPWKGALLSAGLLAFDMISPLKKQFINQLMGRSKPLFPFLLSARDENKLKSRH